jgi:hypothetical protein
MGRLVTTELERMWNGVTLAWFEELSWNFPGDT